MAFPSRLSRLLSRVGTPQSSIRYRAASFCYEELENRVVPATLYWTGDVDANWSTNATGDTNWSSDLLPSNGDDLIFPIMGLNRTNFNDFSNLTLNKLSFFGTNYTIGGNPISLSFLENGSLSGTNVLATPLNLSADLPVSVTIYDSRLIVSGLISGSGGIIKNGRGILSLNGSVPNTYTGTTTVSVGILEMNSDTFDGPLSHSLVIGDSSNPAKSAIVRVQHFNQIPNDCSVTIHSDGWLDTNGFVEGIGALSMDGGATITTGNGSLGVYEDVTVTGMGPASPATISGFLELPVSIRTFTVADGPAEVDLQISASIFLGGIIKEGPGYMVLSGVNTFDGSTTVHAGTLEVKGGLTFFNPVYITGGFLIGSGSIGTLTGTGGTISPNPIGASGIMTTNNVTLGKATLAIDLFSMSLFDQLKVNGTVNVTGGALQTNLGFATTFGNTFRILNNDGTADAIVGTFTGLPEGQVFIANNRSLRISYQGGDGNDIVLMDVGPATGTPLLLGSKQFTAGTDVGDNRVIQFDPDGQVRFTFTPFPNQGGGFRTASGDFTGDGVADVVVGTGPGGPTHVKVLDGVSHAVLFSVDPFEAAFTGGVYVAAGDINGDGVADLAITPDEGGGPARPRLYRCRLHADRRLLRHRRHELPRRGTASHRRSERRWQGDLIVAAGFGGGPRVAAFNGATLASNRRAETLRRLLRLRAGAPQRHLRRGGRRQRRRLRRPRRRRRAGRRATCLHSRRQVARSERQRYARPAGELLRRRSRQPGRHPRRRQEPRQRRESRCRHRRGERSRQPRDGLPRGQHHPHRRHPDPHAQFRRLPRLRRRRVCWVRRRFPKKSYSDPLVE